MSLQGKTFFGVNLVTILKVTVSLEEFNGVYFPPAEYA